MFLHAVIFSGVLLLTGCASHHGLAGRRHEFLKRVERIALSSPKILEATSDAPLPLAAGQWVSFFTRSKKGSRSELGLTTYKVQQVEGNVVTMEIEAESPNANEKVVVTYQIENYPQAPVLAPTKGDMDQLVKGMTFKSVVLKQGDKPAQVMPPDVLAKAGAITQKALARFYRIGNIRPAACATAYIQSTLCQHYQYEGEVAGHTGKGVVWGHSGVPIVHFVQSEDDKSMTQVINYGMPESSK